MKTITGVSVVALAFGLGLAATPVFAADYGQGRDHSDQPAAQQDQNDKGDKDNKGDKGKPDHSRHDNHQNQANQNQGGPKPNGMNKTDWQNNNNNGNANDDRHRGRNNADYNDRNRDQNNNNGGNWNNNNNHNNNRGDDFNRNHKGRTDVNISVYRRNMESPRRYRIGIYHGPRGYSYRRWHYGERLPVEFYARDYWLLDFVAFGLFAPPPGYVWVRYGDDALLIDTETGEIVQVRYDVFYS